MSADNEQLLFQMLRSSQDKYTYFVLAAAGAAIGFAVTQTQKDAMSLDDLFLAASVLSWGFSFYCGCTHIAFVNSALYANWSLIGLQKKYLEYGRHSDFAEAAIAGTRKGIEGNGDKAERYGLWQFRMLVAGSVFYLLWHAFQMYCRA